MCSNSLGTSTGTEPYPAHTVDYLVRRAPAMLFDLRGKRKRTVQATYVYSAGLAIPFLATALAFSRMTSSFGVVRRHYLAIMATGRAVLIVMGVLVYTGELFQLNIEAQKFLNRLDLNFFQDV
jgi:hypothetical protein